MGDTRTLSGVEFLAGNAGSIHDAKVSAHPSLFFPPGGANNFSVSTVPDPLNPPDPFDLNLMANADGRGGFRSEYFTPDWYTKTTTPLGDDALVFNGGGA